MSNVKLEPYSNTIAETIFLQRFWHGDFDGVHHHLATWSSDFGLSILRMEIFCVDATFRITPSLLYQCLIIIAFDPTTNIFIPGIWYCTLIVLLKYKRDPTVVVVGFEKALLKAVGYQFPT
ncbi:hypothetical protein MXB_2521 [Myxobolus squamalis]|nr:hypothetical protein MXB_2521 [Myxobolus squamalis]